MTPEREPLHCKICDAEVCGECGFHVASPKCVCRPLGTDHATGRVTPERELRAAVTAKADEWEREYAVDSPEIRKARLQCATELRRLLIAAPAPAPAWLTSAKRLEKQFNGLLEAMYEELKPGPTGGNDYYDAWQVFGEQLTVAHEVISALKELPAPTPAPPTPILPDTHGARIEIAKPLTVEQIMAGDGKLSAEPVVSERPTGLAGIKAGLAEAEAQDPNGAVVPERETHLGWSLAKEIAADLEDAGLVESGLAGIKAMEVIERRLAAAPRAAQREITLDEHLAHVQQFLNDMYATMIDPCDQPKMKVAEMCELLLKTAREQREQAHQAPRAAGGQREALEWLIKWDRAKKLHPSQDACVTSLATLLAAAGGQREHSETWTAQVTPSTCDGNPAKSLQFFVSDQFADGDVVYVTVSAAPPPASLRADGDNK